MDESWKKIYNENATKDLPIHKISCWTEEGFEELLKTTLKIVKNLKEIKTVIDVGCGPGIYANALTQLGLSVTGIDYSSSVINKAKKMFPHLNFIEGTAYNLPTKEKFDLVLCIGLLQCVFEPEKVLKELIKVSKKHILISTLLRNYKVENPTRLIEKKLETDTWPTRDYHPTELENFFTTNNYTCKTITKNNKEIIKDGFFILATKKE